MRLVSKIIAGITLAVLAYIAVGGMFVAAASPLTMRGELVDIGAGRRMHLICEGPKGAGPTVLFEAGAFGFSADWGVVQERSVKRGWRTCSTCAMPGKDGAATSTRPSWSCTAWPAPA